MKKKLLIFALVFAIVSTCAIGTLAYLTDDDNAGNTFTVGDVYIDLFEKDAGGLTEIQDGISFTHVVPGVTQVKETYIKNTGHNPAYVRMSLELPSAWDAMLQKTINVGAGENQWTLADTRTSVVKGISYTKYIYTYNSILAVGATTTQLLGSVTVNSAIDNVDYDNLATAMGKTKAELILTLNVYAEAIQSEGFANAGAAWSAYEAQ